MAVTRAFSLSRSLFSSTKQTLTSLLSLSSTATTTASPSLRHFSLLRLRPLSAAVSLNRSGSFRTFATRQTQSSLSDSNPNWSNRPPKETILLDGCDFEHWLVVMEPPPEDMTRDDIIDMYIKTLAQVVGSEEEARMKMYSVSTRHYFAFGALVSEELSYKIKELPKVRWVLPDSYLDVKNKDYGGEPFINGQAVPYDPKYHEEWVRNNQRAQERNRRNDRPRNADRSRNFERRRQNMQNPGYQSSPMPTQPMQSPPPNMGGPANNNMGGGMPPNNNMGGGPNMNMPPYSQGGAPNVPPNSMGGAPNMPPNVGPNMGGVPPNYAGGAPNMPPNAGPHMGGMPPNYAGGAPNMPPNAGPHMGGMPPNYAGVAPNMPPNAGPHMGGMPPNYAGGAPNMPPNAGPHMGGMPPNYAGGAPNMPPNAGANMGRMPPSNMGGGPNMLPNVGPDMGRMPPNMGGAPNMGGTHHYNMGGAANMGGGAPNAGWSGNVPQGNSGDNMPNYQNNGGMPYHQNTQMPGGYQNSYTPNSHMGGPPGENVYQTRDVPGRDAPPHNH